MDENSHLTFLWKTPLLRNFKKKFSEKISHESITIMFILGECAG